MIGTNSRLFYNYTIQLYETVVQLLETLVLIYLNGPESNLLYLNGPSKLRWS